MKMVLGTIVAQTIVSQTIVSHRMNHIRVLDFSIHRRHTSISCHNVIFFQEKKKPWKNTHLLPAP